MFYKLLINYFRLKIMSAVLGRLLGKGSKLGSGKSANISAYVLELLVATLLKPKRKTK